jgi:NADH:quinone reductase (non-electrogenic)
VIFTMIREAWPIVVRRFARRILIGALAGLAASFILVLTQNTAATAVLTGLFVGIVYAATSSPTPHAYAASSMTAASLGVPAWLAFSVILHPLLAGRMPAWANPEMRTLFPELVGWVLYGASLGLLTQALNDIALARFGAEPESRREREPEQKHVVILGGGFAGSLLPA